jgi:hypothetical protein
MGAEIYALQQLPQTVVGHDRSVLSTVTHMLRAEMGILWILYRGTATFRHGDTPLQGGRSRRGDRFFCRPRLKRAIGTTSIPNRPRAALLWASGLNYTSLLKERTIGGVAGTSENSELDFLVLAPPPNVGIDIDVISRLVQSYLGRALVRH